MTNHLKPVVILGVVCLLGLAGLAQAWPRLAPTGNPARKGPMTTPDTPARSDVPVEYTWNTKDLYASDEAWESERVNLLKSLKNIESCKGTLKQGKPAVLACLTRFFEAHKTLTRLVNYAHRLHDQDTRVASAQAQKAVVEKTATEFGEAASFLRPELLALPEKTLKALIADADLTDYNQFLKELLRVKPHVLGLKEEALLAATSQTRETGYQVYSTFTAADLSFPEVKDEQGRKVKLTQSLFGRFRQSEDRRVRKAAFEAFFGTFKQFRNTTAALLSAQINANATEARIRRYGSALEAALDANDVPVSVYHNMIKAVNSHLPLLHRYLGLRRSLLGLKDLRYYDMYPPIVKKVDLRYTYEQGNQLIVEAMAPMGSEYTQTLAQGLKPGSGWVDAFPNQGKRSGAYMAGSAYGVHPFVLSNFLGDFSSVSTIAHEMGHALHSYLSNKNQPYPKADYSIFVAEVASTFNEALLMSHMLRRVKDPKERLFLLGEQLESFRQTLFRQAMFAEFELALYALAEKKEALTAEVIDGVYLAIVRRYYGHDAGVVNVEDLYGTEWSYVPHFYYNFYVYQYVTGITAATALAEMVQRDGAQAALRYRRHLLEAGCSDAAIRLLQQAGVDLTSTAPYDLAMGVFKRTLDEVETLASQGGQGTR